MTRLEVTAHTIPTDRPESDGTLAWDSTTIVVVRALAGDVAGLGYTYGAAAAAELIRSELAPIVEDGDPLDVPGAWAAMRAALRNSAPFGLAAYALSAVDVALWDLKARLLDVSLARLLGRCREAVPVYGSGGFCSYSLEELAEQLGGWAARGIRRVKMKVGRDQAADPERVEVARAAIGDDVELMVDGNGAYTPDRAVAAAERFAEHGVTWFEEPVTSDDLDGLRLVRSRAPAGMAIAAGEYVTDPAGFRRMIDAVDVVQGDVTRAGGITGLLQADALCMAANRPFSAHCAPAVSAHACCGMETLEHLEYFHDHVRLEAMLFDGTLDPQEGYLEPDRSRPGLGLELRREDAREFEL
jgi:L-alanine-DL-glutamate epimerase-like enolase superfamily enzyme